MKASWRTAIVIGLLSATAAFAIETADIPAGPPQDAIMAKPAEVAAFDRWARAVFLQQKAADQPALRVEVQRQDHNTLHFNRSVLDTPLAIGKRSFARGLGTHANSVLRVVVPAGARSFEALAGIDNNYDTAGQRGSAEFSVEIGGKEVVRTPVLRGGGAAAVVKVEIPAGCTEMVLKTHATGDGTSYDQTDWADARLAMADGSLLWLDAAGRGELLDDGRCFSFRYGGRPAAEPLAAWRHEAKTEAQDDGTSVRSTWTDPATGLVVTAQAKLYSRWPAADWVLTFENTGKADTPLLEDIQALDLGLRTGGGAEGATLHYLLGDSCGADSFKPMTAAVAPGRQFSMAPAGGRSSNGAFPFFTFEAVGQGLIAAIGWSGQWAASLQRQDDGLARLAAGMERTRLVLRPGETIRSPRILLMAWQGERQAAQNRFRRLMMHHYSPRQDGRPLAMPVFWQTFDRYHTRPGWATEEGQIAAARLAKQAGCDTYWLDAAWFPGGFPNGVGSWTHRPEHFPRGLKPISDACHAMGMKFILWFEPERVAAGSEIAREHPEFCFGGAGGGLYKLNDPAARKWLADRLSQRIAEYGLDWYRNDFNMDPLPSWRGADTPDRQGMTEIRYVEGHYALWDELVARRPGLLLDNCASGGRRIDLETCARAVPLWHSDTACSPGRADWDQAHTYGLSHYLPFHESCSWSADAYTLRSAAGAGAILQLAYLEPGFDMDEARRGVAEVRANQKYWYGDFYPLTPGGYSPESWIAYRFHRADLDAGMVLAFRRAKCDYSALDVTLRAVNPAAMYRVEWIDEARAKTEKTVVGKDLVERFALAIPRPGQSLLVRYQAVK